VCARTSVDAQVRVRGDRMCSRDPNVNISACVLICWQPLILSENVSVFAYVIMISMHSKCPRISFCYHLAVALGGIQEEGHPAAAVVAAVVGSTAVAAGSHRHPVADRAACVQPAVCRFID